MAVYLLLLQKMNERKKIMIVAVIGVVAAQHGWMERCLATLAYP
jgi:hypothetical protein